MYLSKSFCQAACNNKLSHNATTSPVTPKPASGKYDQQEQSSSRPSWKMMSRCDGTDD